MSAADSSAADGRTSTTKPRRSWTRSTSAPTRSCSAGGPTRSSPAHGDHGQIRATGQGARLFADSGPDTALDLVDSRVTRKGVTIQVYRPTGRPRYATATMSHSYRSHESRYPQGKVSEVEPDS